MIDPPMHARCVSRCLLLCVALLLGACNAPQGDDDAAAQAPASRPAVAVGSKHVPAPRSITALESTTKAPGRVDVVNLHAHAERAMAERRLLDPAGDNALEYYLALRDAAPGDVATDNALSELQPYALIATEQALADGDVLQARRMVALLARSDPAAPALPRLHDELKRMDGRLAASALAERDALARAAASDAALARAALEQEQAAVARAAQARSASAAASIPAAAPVTTPAAVASVDATAANESRASTPNNLPQVAEVVPQAPATAAPPPSPRPSSARSALPRLVSDAIPRFPLIAINRGIEGSVVVAFTVMPDGSVSNARIQSATPPGIFDNAALSAAARWRFAPSTDSHATTRTLAFPLQVQPGSKRGPATRPEAG